MRRVVVVALLLAACGDGAPAAFDRALAALRDGDLRGAQAWAERAAQRDGAEFAALHDFLRGNIAFVRCETAERQAITTAAEPFAFDVAILYGKKARDFWQLAAMSRPDWPAARRNVERALLKLRDLQKKKADAVERSRRDPDPQPEPKPLPPPGGDRKEDDAQPPEDEPALKELSPEQVLALIERLAQKEQEKRALRRTHRQARMAGAERDW